uniref:Uncharacterized protein n=1 Tax=Trichogramma kaykai TaxID=54128 RepID=A0ABD2XBT4_9HYME
MKNTAINNGMVRGVNEINGCFIRTFRKDTTTIIRVAGSILATTHVATSCRKRDESEAFLSGESFDRGHTWPRAAAAADGIDAAARPCCGSTNCATLTWTRSAFSAACKAPRRGRIDSLEKSTRTTKVTRFALLLHDSSTNEATKDRSRGSAIRRMGAWVDDRFEEEVAEEKKALKTAPKKGGPSSSSKKGPRLFPRRGSNGKRKHSDKHQQQQRQNRHSIHCSITRRALLLLILLPMRRQLYEWPFKSRTKSISEFSAV